MDGVKAKREVLPRKYAGVRRAVRAQQERIERKLAVSAHRSVEQGHANRIGETEGCGANRT
jgi:hypothetical protein